MRIQFCGAAQTVTGSRHLIKLDDGKQILLDCGLFQGLGKDTDDMNRELGFDPKRVDYLILSHAHIDHSGAIPRLVKLGFKGKIFATPPTIDLCHLMLNDSAHIQESDLKYVNRRRVKRGEAPLEPIYNAQDVEATLKLFVPVDYDEWFDIYDDVKFMFTNTAHIIGSAAISLVIREGNGTLAKLTYTGDIGRPHDHILDPPAEFPQADYIICESTYGAKLHEAYEELEENLLEVVTRTCINQKGKLIIPAFSVDRTQEVIYALDRMEHAGKIPKIKVFVDSPLSVNATYVMKKHKEYFNDTIKAYIQKDSDKDAFGFKTLKYITNVNESKALNDLKEPCIIISASGMAEAGRIKHHIKNNIGKASNTILLVGYCTPHSLGGRLRAGNESVKIFGEEYEVKAKVDYIGGYSAHADYNEMVEYLACQDKSKIKKMILVHGEYETQQNFKGVLEKEGYQNVVIPEMGETLKLKSY
ncbi:MAG: MBL fold metallo-hydrolase [Bacteroidia bacterium]|nr:MBL fold metallo-hydrolase [Bacteroidia bacterium]NNC85203.1 MBL fold metallo-hydrolase [Bacteroidia bacterium]NNM16909.1 MBL fold metallo-hydrolase [Bacteroidia bacterium]